MLMAKANKLHKEVHMVQIEVQKLQLQVKTKWEVVVVGNQAKVKLCQEKVKAKFKRQHFEHVKNYVCVLDVAYQQMAPSDEIEDDVTTKGEIRQIKKQGKSIE